METITISLIVLGLLIYILWFQRKMLNKAAKFDYYNNESEEWAKFLSLGDKTIYQKYATELRFGPEIVHFKSEPNNAFGKEFYMNWFYRSENGIFLQKPVINPIKEGPGHEPINDLVFFNLNENRIETVIPRIHSYIWKMEKVHGGEHRLIVNIGNKKVEHSVYKV